MFSDGEEKVISNVENMLKKYTNTKVIDLKSFESIIILEGNNFESYLVQNGYKTEIIKAINEYETDKQDEHLLSYFENYKKGYGKNHKIGDVSDKNAVLVECMKKGKAKYATIIAQTICKECNDDKKFPPKILELMEKVKAFLEKNK